MERKTIDFTLKGEYKGVEISPENVDISDFQDLLKDVETLLRPNSRGKRSEIFLGIEKGSLRISANAPAKLIDLFLTDMKHLDETRSLGNINPKRARVLKKWHQNTQKHAVSFNIGLNNENWSFDLSNETPLVLVEDHWVTSELYLFGEVTNIGGISSSNFHLITREYGNVVVSIDRESLRNDEQNRAYKCYLVRVSCEENLSSGKLRNVEFMEWVDYYPEFDQQILSESIESGEKVWGHVSDSASYIRNLRGDDD